MPEAAAGASRFAGHPSLGGLPLIFGGNVFGWTVDRDRGFEILDALYEAGGRMIDTAECYGRGEERSETIIGGWMESRGVRGEMLIATKTGMPATPGALAPEKVRAALEGSLERLRTDYVDLYYVHKDDLTTPLDEVVDVYDEAVRSGKAREIGGSKYSNERLKAMIATAEARGRTPFTVVQPQYNLVARDEFEGELQDFCLARDIAVAPYYSLAAGFLSGKFRSAEDWKGSTRDYALDAASADGGWQVLDKVRDVASRIGVPPAQVAIAWVKAQPGIAAPLASATSTAQLADLVAAVSLDLSAEHLARLDR